MANISMDLLLILEPTFEPSPLTTHLQSTYLAPPANTAYIARIVCPLPNLPTIITMFEIKSRDPLSIDLYRHTAHFLTPKPVQVDIHNLHDGRIRHDHRLISSYAIRHNRFETPA